jgi:uncharacterized protein (TIGR03118 family)
MPPTAPRTRGLLGLAILTTVMLLAGLVGPSSSATATDRATAPGNATAAGSSGFTQVNLVSDVPDLAQVTDFLVSNPWGMALGETTPVWINNNNTATSVVYRGATGPGSPIERALVVQTPAGPTGIAFNPTGAFAAEQDGRPVPTAFLFDSLDGYLSAWGPTAEPRESAIPTRFTRTDGYFGMAVADTPAGPRMYVVSFQGRIKMFDGRFHRVRARNSFVDPKMGDLVPYNVAVFGDRVFVAYFNPNTNGGGAISIFDLRGRFLRRLTTNRHLNAPWGMAIAPAHWGGFGNRLLVGNVSDGRISAFSLRTGRFRGQLRTASGRAIANSGLWAITFGNGMTGTPRDLLFAAGIDDYTHGLFGLIHPN